MIYLNYQSHLNKFEKTNKNIFLQELASSNIQTKITSFLQQSYTLTEKGMQEANKNFSEVILQAAKYSLKTVSRKEKQKDQRISRKGGSIRSAMLLGN